MTRLVNEEVINGKMESAGTVGKGDFGIKKMDRAEMDEEKKLELDRLYMDLGKAYYEGAFEDPLPQLLPLFEQISEMLVVEEEASLCCASCGAELEEDARFCAVCGTPVRQPEPEPEPEPEPVPVERFCKNCGNKLREDAVFCGMCGTKA